MFIKTFWLLTALFLTVSFLAIAIWYVLKCPVDLVFILCIPLLDLGIMYLAGYSWINFLRGLK